MPLDTRAVDVDAPVARIDVGVLGPVCTRLNGDLVSIPGTRARALLVALACAPGQSRSVGALLDDVWPDARPRAPKNALQTQVSRLRSALPPGTLQTSPAGYRLVSTPEQLDLTCAEVRVGQARAELAAGSHDAALVLVDAARVLWRGEPGSDLPDGVLADDLRARAGAAADALDAIEIAALLGKKDFERALAPARRAVARDALDEPAAADLMRCLHGLGRSNDALAVFAELRERLADRLGTDPSGELIELNAEILAPPAPRAPVSVGLRASPNVLIGRERDIDAIENLMTRARVTTIVGPGGSGKTRLANEIGSRAASSKPVALVELASLRSGQDVVATISGTLGLSETDLKIGGIGLGRMRTAGERLREALSGKPVLLILDNCEHLIDDVASVVDDLVGASELLTVLATSRAPMSITSESAYPLPPLSAGGIDSPAATLFVSRARAVRPGASFDPVEVNRLCRTLDGLPLAIELAAARVRSLTVADINTRLEHRFALLRSSDRTRPERHRTLHAVIEWSWNLLEFSQQRALARLCGFPAGFTVDAAERVAGFEGVDDVADALDGLVRQSLLTVVDENDHVRYHMLETVREFGEEQLGDDEAAEVRARMLAWGSDVARTAAGGYRAVNQIEMIRLLEADHDNLLDILRHAVDKACWPEAYALFAALAFFWALRGAHTEVLNWAPRMMDAPEDVLGGDDDHVVLTHVVLLAHVGRGGGVRDAARVRVRLRRSLRERAGVEPGLRFVGEVLIGRTDGRGLPRRLADGVRASDASVRSAAFMIRAALAENFGYLHLAAQDADVAYAIAVDRGDVWGIATASQSLGSIHGQSGRSELAVSHYARAADLMWELHSYDESAQMRGLAGAALIAAGRIDEGRKLIDDVAAMSVDGESAIAADADQQDQRMASITATRAEADIAEGRIESGLALYRRSTEIAGFSDDSHNDPYLTLLASASVAAHSLYGAADRIADTVVVLQSVSLARLGGTEFRDLPQLGSVACAVGSFDVQSGRDRGRGVRLIALSVKVYARQDYSSMRPELHLDAARRVLGAAAVDAAVARVAHTTRAEALDEILELLRP
ncbi:BTAD domain-containing putative transcriptional regulator [Rhodococcoides kyotonense]|uniref:Predicted ATPase n=1 Tax=Rhodococcoides kyotonense TaxID=398843 RepID=A0A239M4T2_9NOCA|nr:BTAD domain-containing putative transcriptional regulator [Rhodococcus kyotonensis]SNT37631.1 Predicted ATPase [Rhodococcus kyotonensis]